MVTTVLASIVTGFDIDPAFNDATYAVTFRTASLSARVIAIGRICWPKISLALTPRMPLLKLLSCRSTYQSGSPAIIGAFSALLPSPFAP